MKKLLTIFFLLTFIFSLNAQVDYSVNAGLNLREVGLTVAFTVGFELKKKLTISNEVQLQHTIIKDRLSTYLTNSEDAPRVSILRVSSNRLNLNTEIDYQLLSFVNVGVGLNAGFRLSQNIGLKTSLSNPELLGPYVFNPFTFGGTVKIRFDIKAFNIQLRYIHFLNYTRSYFIIVDGVETNKIVTVHPLQFSIGYTF